MSDISDREFAEVIAPTHTPQPPLSAWRQLGIWLNIGMQSFGGGAATLYLIRRAAVEQHGWLTDEEFTRYWGICQISPGINLIGLCILIGWRVASWLGVAAALAGLLLPSAAITVALTAGYASVDEQPMMRAALRGTAPATVGLGLLLAYTMVRPLLATGRREGRASFALAWALLLGSALLATLGTPVLGVLWGGGGLAALGYWRLGARQGRPR
jgi:chromate transporter